MLGIRTFPTLFGIALGIPRLVYGQEAAAPTGPVIDTIIIKRDNVFPPEQAEGSFVAKAGDAIHPRTNRWVIESTVLFKAGDSLDMFSHWGLPDFLLA